MARSGLGLGGLLLVAAACASPASEHGGTPTTAAVPAATASPSPSPPPPAPPAPSTGPVRIVLRVERHVGDQATEDFAATVRATLTDPRGWRQAGFEFAFADDAPYRIVLVEGPAVDRLCWPYDTSGRFSCQNGPVVALNADRWRAATSKWTGDLETYRRMLVNHEVGHLLGQHHPAEHCPRPGQPAPVMAQQSTELDGCVPNAWPLRSEIECAARHEEPLAPGYEEDPQSSCQPGR